MYVPGNLVKVRKAIYSSGPSMRIAEGTVGVILQGPTKGYEGHCQVQFVAVNEPWWVNFSEIEPHH